MDVKIEDLEALMLVNFPNTSVQSPFWESATMSIGLDTVLTQCYASATIHLIVISKYLEYLTL